MGMNEPMSIAIANALHCGSARGLAADVLVAQALNMEAHTICTALIVAGRGTVTDITEIPVDTVRAQIEHLETTVSPQALMLGVLGDYKQAESLFGMAERLGGPTVMDVVISGSNGETLLTPRGVSTLKDQIGVPTLITINKVDAELLSGGEITSLDDAQVAAQRLERLGAKNIVLRCGSLNARFFPDSIEVNGADQAASPDSRQDAHAYMADLYYDGKDFAVFESPRHDAEVPPGARNLLSLAILNQLVRSSSLIDSIQHAKKQVTDVIYNCNNSLLPFHLLAS